MTALATLPRSWTDLLELDPELAEIDWLLARYRRAVTENNGWMIYARAKDQLQRRVGFTAWHAVPELRTSQAYEIGLEHILDILGI